MELDCNTSWNMLYFLGSTALPWLHRRSFKWTGECWVLQNCVELHVVLRSCCFPSFGVRVTENQFVVKEMCICVSLVSCWFSLISSCEWMSLPYLEAVHLGVSLPKAYEARIFLFVVRSKNSSMFCRVLKEKFYNCLKMYLCCLSAFGSSYSLHVLLFSSNANETSTL